MSFYGKVLEKINVINCIKKERGAIFVLTALLLPVMFGCLGMAYDVGNLYMHKARLQNMTDAAALAGGRAFLESQKKSTGIKDDVDDADNGHGSDNPYTYTIAGIKNRSSVDGITYDSRRHADADKAADDYIYNNIINLGETVHADKYSHYALKGIKKNAATEGQEATYTAASEIFYRVGLSETVPLYFLPIITKKKVETVRAGSVVVLQPGTTTVVPGSGGGSSTITHTSIFDNLFTFSESLFTRNNIDSDGTIHQSFFGDMVYTHQNGLLDGDLNNSIYFESSTPGPADDSDATNTNQNHWYEQMGGSGSSSTVTINDPIIDTIFDTKAYLEAFRKKLDSYHIEVVTNQAKIELKASDINSENSYLYNKTETLSIDGNPVHQRQSDSNFLYLQDSNYDYYPINKENNNYMAVQEGDNSYSICYHQIPSTDRHAKCVKIGSDYYLLNSDNQITNIYINGNGMYINKNGEVSLVRYQNNAWEIGIKSPWWDGYDYSAIPLSDIRYQKYPPEPIQGNNFFQLQNDSLYTANISLQKSNIIHVPLNYKVNNDTHSHSNVDIILDEPLNGDENTPIYIIMDGIGSVEIKGNAATTRRPVIIVFLSEDTKMIKYEFKGEEFKGVIYAPISDFEHVQKLTGAFRGNIITKDIYIQASSSMTWTQENFLENTNYTDADIKAVSDANKQKIEEANAALTAEIRQKLLDRLGVTAEQMDSKDWFEHLRYPDKQNLYNKWKALYEEYKNDPAVRNILWPWNEHFDLENGEDQTVTTDEKLRLINYRMEYQTKDDGSIEDGKVLDPFIFKTLAKPDSY